MPNIASADLLRVHGWRSPAKQIAGGIVWAANCDVSSSTAYDAVPSYLLYMTEGGKVKVLMQGAHFGAIEVFNDRLYFGVNSGYHGNNYTRIRNGNPMLMSMPLEQIINGAPPAITENFSYTYVAATGTFPSQSGGSGINGVIGGYPTLGYRGGVLRINSSVANVLTILTWAATRNSSGTFGVVCKAYAPIALQANVVQDIDLSEYIKSGDILGYYLSSNCALAGRVVIHPNPVEQYNATAGVNYMLVNGATANGNGTGIYFPKLNKVFGALLTGTGAVSATVTLRGSVDGVNYDQLGIMTLSGTTSVYLTQVNNGAYQYVRADITNLTGTSAAITVTVGA